MLKNFAEIFWGWDLRIQTFEWFCFQRENITCYSVVFIKLELKFITFLLSAKICHM